MQKLTVAAAIIENDNGKVLICKRSPYGNCAGLWEFPGGKKLPGETLEDCVARECYEELDVQIRINGSFFRTSYVYHDPDIDINFTFFRACIISGTIKDSTHSEVIWVHKNELENFDFCPADKEIIALLNGKKPTSDGT